MSNIQRWAFTPQGMEKRQLQDDDGHWVRDTDYVSAIDEMARTHHIRLNRVLDLVANVERERDTAREAVKREQRQFASLATEKREVAERLNGQLYESNKALSTSAQECRRLREQLNAALMSAASFRESRDRTERALAEAKRQPPSYAQPALPNCTYRLSFGPELDAEFLKQEDCVVIVLRHANRAPVMPGSSISRVD